MSDQWADNTSREQRISPLEDSRRNMLYMDLLLFLLCCLEGRELEA